jgi:hypothetical protein
VMLEARDLLLHTLQSHFIGLNTQVLHLDTFLLFFCGCNCDAAHWQSCTKGISLIWLQVGEESRKF